MNFNFDMDEEQPTGRNYRISRPTERIETHREHHPLFCGFLTIFRQSQWFKKLKRVQDAVVNNLQ